MPASTALGLLSFPVSLAGDAQSDEQIGEHDQDRDADEHHSQRGHVSVTDDDQHDPGKRDRSGKPDPHNHQNRPHGLGLPGDPLAGHRVPVSLGALRESGKGAGRGEERTGNPTRKGASAMLAITETAATAIKELTAAQEQPDEAGVRIAAREAADVNAPDSLELSLVDGPAEDDEVVDEHGAHVFLEPRAASYLEDKLLDAHIEGQRVRFAVTDQPS